MWTIANTFKYPGTNSKTLDNATNIILLEPNIRKQKREQLSQRGCAEIHHVIAREIVIGMLRLLRSFLEFRKGSKD
jgi:hypothetical protein